MKGKGKKTYKDRTKEYEEGKITKGQEQKGGEGKRKGRGREERESNIFHQGHSLFLMKTNVIHLVLPKLNKHLFLIPGLSFLNWRFIF